MGAPPTARVTRLAEVPHALDAAGLRRPSPVVVLVGGAGGMSDRDQELLAAVVRTVVVPLAAELDATVVDGGTDAGIMRVVGRESGGAVPLVGVAAVGTVLAGAGPTIEGAAELEPHHTLVVLVPGAGWGDESPWLADVADVIAGGGPSCTLVVNGGEITYDDVTRSVDRARPVVVLAGTGRTADEIAGARAGRPADHRATDIAGSALVRVIGRDDVDALRDTMRTLLSGP